MKKTNLSENKRKIYSFIGLASILSGSVLLIENMLNTFWLFYLIPVIIGISSILCGLKFRHGSYQLFGWIFLLCGIVFVYIIQFNQPVLYALGLMFFVFGMSWLGYFIANYLSSEKIIFSALIPFFNFISIGSLLIFTRLRFLDFVFFIGLGITISILSSGLYWKIFGLIIPGSLLAGIIPGVYFPWEQTSFSNPLIQTGMMLVWFALGWGFITVFSRVQTQAFVWWPLIPGGILAMVGWGLYIGGSPENAVGFIGNTGSIALIIFGIYILLMKRGLHR